MTKHNALYMILNFGRTEEHELLADGKKHEAYQIEHARSILLYALNKSIKRVREVLEKMIESTIDDNGFLRYDARYFVADDYTRSLISEFKSKFSR